jgi:hypothetical protein
MEQEKEQKVFHVIVGSKMDENFKELLEEKLYTFQKQASALDSDATFKIINLTDEEMKQVVETRMALKEEETVLEFLSNDKEKENAKSLVIRMKEQVEKDFGDQAFYTTKQLKEVTSFSWSKIKSVVNTLKLFGFIDEVKGNVIFTIPEEHQTETVVDSLNYKIRDLEIEIERAKSVITNKEVIKKLTALKRKLSTKL